MHKMKGIKDRENNLYKAIIIMGREAERLCALEHTTIKEPVYKAIDNFIDGKINYVIIEEE
ncbi:hypothetical protein KAW18_06580 [candidate division WOR-3 bacterium]|nr:hypothetical protein [candidate division WOR-3 bacterium]MCK4527019.1 hypothetical protein [candidate division WOR-3 bacterium]